MRLRLLLLLEKLLQVVSHLSDLELFPQRLQLLQFQHILLLLLILLLGRLRLGLSEEFVDEEAASVGYLRGRCLLVQALDRRLLLKLIACGGLQFKNSFSSFLDLEIYSTAAGFNIALLGVGIRGTHILTIIDDICRLFAA